MFSDEESSREALPGAAAVTEKVLEQLPQEGFGVPDLYKVWNESPWDAIAADVPMDDDGGFDADDVVVGSDVQDVVDV